MMAPLRGRGGRGGRGRGGRGAALNGKLARSGIRTRAGYRKFDSQRVKEVDDEESEGEEEPEVDQLDDEDDLRESDNSETVPTERAYNTLLQSFRKRVEQNERERKRRKIEVDQDTISVGEDGDLGADVRLDIDSEPVDDEDERLENGDVLPSDDEVVEGISDPFEVHFANPDENELSRRLKSIQSNSWRVEKQMMSGVGNFTLSALSCVEGGVIRKQASRFTDDLPLKKRLATSASQYITSLDSVQQAIAPYLCNYSDLLLANRTPPVADSLRGLACLHALNHVLKGRDRVLKNNTRLSHSDNPDLNIQDQGFTRPKILILLETRQMCAKYAHSLVQLFAPEQQENKQRFLSSFSAPIDERDTMSEDYRELFEGNNDNNFLTALKFTRKTLKLYAPFYTSDIILASPLGLRRIVENEDSKKRDHDFLSSIEMVIVDQADAMYMQNWTNVESVFRHLNLPPTETHGFDISRVRSWYLDGHAKHLRQTVVFSAYITPEMNKLFNTSMLNVAGKAKLVPAYSEGAISSIGNEVKQTFSRFESSPSSPATDPDARFKYFTSTVLPTLLRHPKPADGAKGILIFIPSYYDFLRLRNSFATSTQTQNTSFGIIHEYSEVSAQRRARSHFLSGRHSILMYTQRAHHFYRLKIRGVKKVVMYGVPDNPLFYEEIVGGFLGTSLEEGKMSVEEAGARVMFSRWDGLALERIVGTGRLKGMLGGKGDTFEFV